MRPDAAVRRSGLSERRTRSGPPARALRLSFSSRFSGNPGFRCMTKQKKRFRQDQTGKRETKHPTFPEEPKNATFCRRHTLLYKRPDQKSIPSGDFARTACSFTHRARPEPPFPAHRASGKIPSAPRVTVCPSILRDPAETLKSLPCAPHQARKSCPLAPPRTEPVFPLRHTHNCFSRKRLSTAPPVSPSPRAPGTVFPRVPRLREDSFCTPAAKTRKFFLSAILPAVFCQHLARAACSSFATRIPETALPRVEPPGRFPLASPPQTVKPFLSPTHPAVFCQHLARAAHNDKKEARRPLFPNHSSSFPSDSSASSTGISFSSGTSS